MLKIGTRGSKLALYQANLVKQRLEEKGFSAEVIAIKTKGDIILDVPLSKIGDKGLFTKEIEECLLRNEVDLAVHSLKDLPTTLPEGLKLGAVLERAERCDAFVSLKHPVLTEMPMGSVIATSSLRRKSQLLMINPAWRVIDIRGNVGTRLEKLKEGYCDALIMAAAGLTRLGYEKEIREIIPPEYMIPAVSQGIIAIENRQGDEVTDKAIQQINHEATWMEAAAERAFLRALEGGCQVPIGCYIKHIDGEIKISGFVSSVDGREFIHKTKKGRFEDVLAISLELAGEIYESGGKKILEDIRKM
ncbi:MAG: hydroxymethylbilane synthase [Bacteroidales bacterium]|nr:hydroxymethylbilane synthase [Bacteroidales bacterium]